MEKTQGVGSIVFRLNTVRKKMKNHKLCQKPNPWPQSDIHWT